MKINKYVQYYKNMVAGWVNSPNHGTIIITMTSLLLINNLLLQFSIRAFASSIMALFTLSVYTVTVS